MTPEQKASVPVPADKIPHQPQTCTDPLITVYVIKCFNNATCLLLLSLETERLPVPSALNPRNSHTLTACLERAVNFFMGLLVYFTVTTGASAKNTLIFLACSGFVENAMKAARKEDISSHKLPILSVTNHSKNSSVEHNAKQNWEYYLCKGISNFSRIDWDLSCGIPVHLYRECGRGGPVTLCRTCILNSRDQVNSTLVQCKPSYHLGF